jgi:cell division protein FtsZ
MCVATDENNGYDKDYSINYIRKIKNFKEQPMTLNLHLPTQDRTLRPNITVVGVGGAGGNAVNNMISAALEGVQFVVANTDAQALSGALTDRVIQLGRNLTQGLGAGATPEIGQAAAEETAEEIMNCIAGSHMVFITAGMGGGTGTGAAPVVARMAREQGMLTVGVVTKPFQFEGGKRMKSAEAGLLELQKYVDTLIVIPNQNLFRIANERTTFADAFRMADEVLHSGVRGVTDLMVKPGLVNLDFADIRTVMQEMGKAMMGTGEASGEKRAIEAAEAAISNPLLDDVSLKGARAALINITGGMDMTLYEVDEAANRIREEIDGDANIIFGSTFNESMQGTIRVSVVATGIDASDMDNDNAAQAKNFNKPTQTQQANNFRPTSTGADNNVQQATAATVAPSIPSAFRSEPRISSAAPTARPVSAQPRVNSASEYQSYNNNHTNEYHNQAVREAAQPKPAMRNNNVDNSANYEKTLNAATSVEQRPQAEHRGAHEQHHETDGNGAFRILSKIADVGRSLNSRPEGSGRNIEASEQNYGEAKQETYDDYRSHEESNQYDIPAFLRRKNQQ